MNWASGANLAGDGAKIRRRRRILSTPGPGGVDGKSEHGSNSRRRAVP
uniref:Uncharacterized protein n=1 Tax=Arundo donax TaxID=35708 RepID=A0A0A9FN60_ARUDO